MFLEILNRLLYVLKRKNNVYVNLKLYKLWFVNSFNVTGVERFIV